MGPHIDTELALRSPPPLAVLRKESRPLAPSKTDPSVVPCLSGHPQLTTPSSFVFPDAFYVLTHY